MRRLEIGWMDKWMIDMEFESLDIMKMEKM